MPKSVGDLLHRMSLDEKVAQLSGPAYEQLAILAMGDPDDPATALAKGLPRLAPHGVGHLAMVGGLCPDLDALPGFIARIQEAVMGAGRFPIPALVHLEALNGVVHPGAPTYPTAIAQAATWNPALVGHMARLTRERLRFLGVRLALSPVLDITRDPRWGRGHETYGEDPDLAAAFGVAFVRGLQGEDLRGGVAACGKHFIAYAAPQAGLNCAGTLVGPRTLREQYARPFEAAIREAGLATVMNSYSEIDGMPVAADPGMLDTLLRRELGFTGTVVSDYGSLDHLATRFGLAADADEAGSLAVTSGMDVELPEFRTFTRLGDLVRDGRLDEAVVDRAARRVLELKADLGLLDHVLGRRTAVPAPEPADIAEEHALSRAIAVEAVTLLQNDGVLPVPPITRRLAVVGELGAQIRVHYGAYSGVALQELNVSAVEAWLNAVQTGEPVPTGGLDDTQGMRAIPTPDFPSRFEDMAGQLETHAVSIGDALERVLGGATEVVRAPFGGPEGTSEDDLAQAAQAVDGTDVAIVVVGERTGWVGPVTAGEQVDRQDLRLPGDQDALVEAVAALGVPTVVVVASGRPLLLDRVGRCANAVLWAPLLGPAAGLAVADVLVGNTAPAGRLPVTFPASVGQIPIFHGSRAGSGYDKPGGADGPTYIDGPTRPLFPFGHGLTYTEFAYGEATAEAAEVRAGDDLSVRVDITNTGDRLAEEVVQLYARDVVASTVRPVRQLLAFARVRVPAGETRRVRLSAPVNALALIDPADRLVVEPGTVDLMVGPSSTDIRARTSVVVTGETAEIPRAGRFLGSAEEIRTD